MSELAMRDAPGSQELLRVENLHAFYGESHILHGVAFGVARGEVVTLLGRNGVGKTTTLRAIMAMVSRRTGSIRFEGAELIRMRSNDLARLGKIGRTHWRGSVGQYG